MIFVAELHGVERFESPGALAAYLGLVPTLYASGDSARHGKITKTGNGHIRRALVQACWQYRHRPGLGIGLRKRRDGQPERVLAIAEKAERRLNSRHGARSSAELEGAKASAAPRSGPQLRKTSRSKTEVGQRRKAQQEKRAT